MYEEVEVEPNAATIQLVETEKHPVLVAFKERIAELEKSIESKNDTMLWYQNRYTAKENQLNNIQRRLKETIIDILDDGRLSRADAESLAESAELEITKTISVSGSITFSGQVEVSIFDEDIDRYNAMMNIDLSIYNATLFGNDIDNLDYDVEDVQIDE